MLATFFILDGMTLFLCLSIALVFSHIKRKNNLQYRFFYVQKIIDKVK